MGVENTSVLHCESGDIGWSTFDLQYKPSSDPMKKVLVWRR
jgi:hypothetical protein